MQIDLSSIALQKRREIAEKATPGPWKNPGRGFVVSTINEAEPLICDVIRKNNVEHIATNFPDAVIAMIDEIEALRLMLAEDGEELERLWNLEITCLEACGISDAEKSLKNNSKLLISEIEKLHSKNTRLEKELDWLAEEIATLDFLYNSETDCDGEEPKNAEEWREKAHNAIR